MTKPKIIRVGEQDWLASAIFALKKGKSLVYPTDTAYGLGVDATNPKAVEKLLSIKGRVNQPVSIVVSSKPMAERYVEFSPLAEKIFAKLMPGRLTIVLPLKQRVTRVIKDLAAETNALGIRMPDHRTALKLSEGLGRPITTTSANPKGGETPYSVEDSLSQFAEAESQPEFYLDEGHLPHNQPSTIVKVEGDRLEILREGPISEEQIRKITN
jgi:L-threonylcarbamoyladenylate synthase